MCCRPDQQPIPDTGAALRLLDLISGSWATQAIGAAAQLALADHIAHGCDRVEPLARATGTEPEPLRRLLNGLASLGLLHITAAGAISLSTTGQLLRRDAPQSLAAHAQWWAGEAWAQWGDLPGSVRTGLSTRARRHQQQGFDHLEGNTAVAALFHRSMSELTRLVAADIAVQAALPDVGTVMDLGGGHGELLATLLQSRPALQGVLVDLPHAVQGAAAHLAQAGVAARTRIAEASFFEPLPVQADVVLLKSVLHDWADADALRILAHAAAALTPGGRLLIVERVLPAQFEQRAEHRTMARSDLNMLVGLGGRERSRGDFEALLAASGLELVRTRPLPLAYSLVEARGQSLA